MSMGNLLLAEPNDWRGILISDEAAGSQRLSTAENRREPTAVQEVSKKHPLLSNRRRRETGGTKQGRPVGIRTEKPSTV